MTSNIFLVHTFHYKASKQGCGDVSGVIKKTPFCDFCGFNAIILYFPKRGHTYP